MKKILFYFYNEEISISSPTSVTRLIASLIQNLQANYAVTFFSFDESESNATPKKPVLLKINRWSRLLRKVNNSLGLERIVWFTLKRNAVKQYLGKHKNEKYDLIIVLGLDDVRDAREFFPDSKVAYWIHNISAICKKEYLYNVNDADYFLSPSRTTYHLLLQKLQPLPLTAEFLFTPNWCETIFKEKDMMLTAELKKKHTITDADKVFIFSGGDHKLKGKFILEKVLKQLDKVYKHINLVVFFAGNNKTGTTTNTENIRVIELGVLSPGELAAYYQLSHYGLLPSLAYDHCPLTLLEMISCEVLPIASNIGGIKEILGEDYCYLVNEPHAVEAWMDKITEAMAVKEQERYTMVYMLKSKTEKKYDKRKMVETVHNLIEIE